MKRSARARGVAKARFFNIKTILRLGSSPLHPWVSFVIAVFITISAVDDVRLLLQLSPTGGWWLWQAAGTLAYWLVWMSLAFLPRLTPYVFVLMLVAMYPQQEPGGTMLLAFGALALAAYRVPVRALLVILGSFIAWLVAWTIGTSVLGISGLWGLLPATVMLVAPGFVIKVLQQRALRAERLRQDAEKIAAREAHKQRTELARELHDVVTHGLTMIAVQANLGTLTKDDAEKNLALAEIGSMARNSLDDLRRLLQTMRADEPPTPEVIEASVSPSSATINLEHSVTEVQKRLAGLGFPTTVSVNGDLDSTPRGLRSTVVRILQESATNVAKHSGMGTACEIYVEVRDSRLELRIRNRLTAGKPRLPVSGTGLVGLRERASRLGGTLEAGTAGGWWAVRADLPFKGREMLR